MEDEVENRERYREKPIRSQLVQILHPWERTKTVNVNILPTLLPQLQ